MARRSKITRRRSARSTAPVVIVNRPARRSRKAYRGFFAKKTRRHAPRKGLFGKVGGGKKNMIENVKNGVMSTALAVGGFYLGDILTGMFVKDSAMKSYINLGAGLVLLATMSNNRLVKYAASGIALNGGLNIVGNLLAPISAPPAIKGLAENIRMIDNPHQMGVNAFFAGTCGPSMMGEGFRTPISLSNPMSSMV